MVQIFMVLVEEPILYTGDPNLGSSGRSSQDQILSLRSYPKTQQ